MYQFKEAKKKLIDNVIEYNHLSEEQIQQLMDTNIELTKCQNHRLDRIVQRIYQAKDNHEKVFIAGDYDCDGIMAVTILKYTLDALGIENGYYIPNRFHEGYGLKGETVSKVASKGYSLIITVDNGISAFEALEVAKQLHMDVIVTDHHIQSQPIDCYEILHPDYLEQQFQGLCGAGLALLVSRCFLQENYLVVLAMIATIGDVMPVWYENRKLIKYGLQILNTSNYTTIKALLLPKSEYDEYDIAFQVVPKVNAVGRLEDSNPNNLVKYFLLKDDRAILKVATQIIQINNKRKELSQQMVIKGLQDIKEDAIHILYDTSFHQGICGLAAGNIASKINRPTLVLSQKDTILKGSGRSIKGFHLYEYLSQYKELFQSFGGHSQAVGLSLSLKDLETLKSNIEKDEIVFTPMIEDVYLIKHITIDDVKQLQHFRPFGEGFMLPKWAFEVKHIPYTMVKEMYPKWQIQEEVSAICFKDLKILDSTEYVIGAIQLNRYFNKESLQIIVQDIM